MSINSVLRGCHETLEASAYRFRRLDSFAFAHMCTLQAEAVARLLAELAKEEETSDG